MNNQNKFNRADRDLQEYYTQAKVIMMHLGYDVPSIPVTINNRLTRVLGRYFRQQNRIEISGAFFRNARADEIMNTLVHEICHQVSPTSGHTGDWKRIADNVSRNTPYKIERLHRAKTEDDYHSPQKARPYVLECTCCGRKHSYTKKTKAYINYTEYRCGDCKGALKQVIN